MKKAPSFKEGYFFNSKKAKEQLGTPAETFHEISMIM